MELARMATGIIKIIDKEYDQHVDDECLDIIQIKNICNLYKTKNNSVNSISLSEISFSSPEFKKVANKIDKKNQAGVLKSEEFVKKYSFLKVESFRGNALQLLQKITMEARSGRQQVDVAQFNGFEAWQLQTTGQFEREMYPGGHFFIKSDRERFLSSLHQRLSHTIAEAS